MNIVRALTPPKRSFFLFGPRGTGKSTWVREHFKDALWFNLLKTSEVLALQQDPDLLSRRVCALPPQSWIVIDEVQRLPWVLNEVHNVLAEKGEDFYRFVLTGSSARKLKRSGVNLLAGRAVRRSFFPISSIELIQSQIAVHTRHLMKRGSLPRIFSESTDFERIDFLEAYVDTYLKEEIKEEALVRRLDPFARFLGVSANLNGQKLNFEKVGREIGTRRTTVSNYYEVLEDTLIGVLVPAFQPRVRIKEVAHPKFYFFDTGVVRTLCQRHRISELDALEQGFLFETLVLGELRAWNEYQKRGFEIKYWATPAETEIDFVVISASEVFLAIEVKSSVKYRSEYSTVLREWKQNKKCEHAWVILPDVGNQEHAGVKVLSFISFVKELWNLP